MIVDDNGTSKSDEYGTKFELLIMLIKLDIAGVEILRTILKI